MTSTKTKTLILCLAILFFGFWITTHFSAGYFSVDDSEYHFMVKAFCEKGQLHINNGYEEIPSQELSLRSKGTRTTIINNGKLYPMVPFLYTIIAAPFYLCFGINGLVLLNLIAFFLTALLVYHIGKNLFSSPPAGILSAFLFLFGSFGIEYAFGIWPHAINTCLITASVWITVLLNKKPNNQKYWLLSCLLGFLVFFNVGVRLDAILIAFILLFTIIVMDDRITISISGYISGSTIPIAAMILLNKVRHGSYNIMCYSARSVDNIVLIFLFLTIVASALIIRQALRKRLNPKKWLFAFSALILILGIGLHRHTLQILKGVYTLLFDLRLLPDRHVYHKDILGGLLYLNAYKKALFQSCPHFILSIPAIYLIIKRGLTNPQKWIPYLPIATIPMMYIGYYGYYQWVGGLCFNLRYLLPTLPFLAILSAWILNLIWDKTQDANKQTKNYDADQKPGIINRILSNRSVWLAACLAYPLVILYVFRKVRFISLFTSNTQHGLFLHFLIPYVALLLFIMIHQFVKNRQFSSRNWIIIYIISSLLFILFLHPNVVTRLFPSLLARHIPILLVPSMFLTMVVFCSLFFIVHPKKFNKTMIILFLLGLAYSQSLTFNYDSRMSTRRKKYHNELSKKLSHHITNHAVLFSTLSESIYGIQNWKSDVIFANPQFDQFNDFFILASYFLEQNRRVYLFLTPEWKDNAVVIASRYHVRFITDLDNQEIFQMKKFFLYEIFLK